MVREPLSIREEDGVAVVAFLEPNLEYETVIDEIGEQLYALPERGLANLVIDFTGVRYVASSLLGKLISLHRRATLANGQVILCGFSPYVRTIFEISRLNRIFPIRENEDEALAFLKAAAAAPASGSGA